MQVLLLIRFRLARGEPEAEGMTAAKTNIFGPLATSLVDSDQVANHHTGQRVPDPGKRSFCLEKRVPAAARILGSSRSRFHNMNAMAKEPAEVVNPLFEFVMAGIWIAG